MKVSEILNSKVGDVITIRPNAILAGAIGQLVANKIGSMPVCEPDGTIVGLLTERDILHGLAAHGTSIMVMRVDELMSKKVYRCTPDDTLKHIMGVMTEKHVRHLLVMVDNRLADIVSIGDVVKCQLEESQLEVDVLRDYARSH